MKIIMHCEPDEAEALAKLIVQTVPMLEQQTKRLGWGWHYCLPNGREFFLRQVKEGISASPTRAETSGDS